MLTVINKDQEEALTHYTGYELDEEVNGALTLSLTSFSVDENPGHSLLEEEAVITVEDGRTFRVKQMTAKGKRKQVKAISTFFDLTGHIKEDMFAGTKKFSDFANWLFQGTGWTYEIVGIPTTTKLVPNFGNANFVKLLEVLLSTWEGERQIMANNHLILSDQLGPDNDAQYRYGHNIKALSKSVDTTNLRTSITAYGGNALKVIYTSPNAALFPHAGAAESFSDDRFLIPENLIEEARGRLIDYPEVAIELDALELTQKALGERVWLIYEPLGIEFQTRILAKKTKKPAERSSAVIGNVLPRTLSDQLIDQSIKIDENAKQSQSRFEQTNERITMEVEQIGGEVDSAKASWVIEATNIRGEVTQLRTYTDDELGTVKENASSNFDILSGQITAAVSTTKEYTDTQTRLLGEAVEMDIQTVRGEVGEIETNLVYLVDDLGTLTTDLATLNGEVLSVKEEASSNFDILSGSISAGVSTTRTYAETVAGQAKTDAQGAAKTYTDGKINTVVSTASADFNLLSGRINAKAEATTVTSLGNRVSWVEFDMDAIEGEISLKVDQTDFNGNQIASLINQSATTIDIQASKINLIGSVTVLSELSGNLGSITGGTITGTTIRLDNGGLLDLRSGTILWGHNVPQADWAVEALSARALNGFTQNDFSLQGHVHASTEYVKPYTGQSIYLWRSGNKVRVYQGGNSYVELTGITGTG